MVSGMGSAPSLQIHGGGDRPKKLGQIRRHKLTQAGDAPVGVRRQSRGASGKEADRRVAPRSTTSTPRAFPAGRAGPGRAKTPVPVQVLLFYGLAPAAALRGRSAS